MHRILIVEDDAAIAAALEQGLSAWGYTVCRAEDFERVMDTFAACAPQLVLLDLALPHYNGFHWCAEIRKISSVPVMFVSSAADNMNTVLALQHGADDFIAKPFDLTVLAAKIAALLRRTYDFGAPAEVLAHRGAVLALGSMTLHAPGGNVPLTPNEFRILQMLLEQKGRVVARDALMRRLWDSESFIDDNTLTVNITRLRKKLEDAGLCGFITTKKGAGYIVEE